MEEDCNVFISYSDHTPQAALQIADALGNAGISYWIARRNLPGGLAFAPEIVKAINGCRVFLLVLDKNSMKSEHVKNELGIAFHRFHIKQPIEILPCFTDESVLSDDLEMYYFLNRLQWMKASPSNEESIRELVNRIAAILSGAVSAPRSVNPSANIILSGSCGELSTYLLDNHGLLIISGAGKMRDFWDYEKNQLALPWEKQRDNISHARIQRGVTSIGKMAFSDCKNLTKVEIADSVTDIRAWAFQNCVGLREISIPSSVRNIGAYAFQGCVNLSHVVIPKEATVNKSAFSITTRREFV